MLHQKLFKRKNSCRLCKSNDLYLLIKMPVMPPVDNYRKKNHFLIDSPFFPMNLLRCNNCKNSQLSHVVNPDILYSNYIYESSSSSDLKSHFIEYHQDLLGHIKIKNPSVLDIGSNDGLFLSNFLNSSILVGVDPADLFVRDKKIKTFKNYFDIKITKIIKKKYNKFDIVTANNVFSHIDDLDLFISNVKILLKKNGIFCFEVSYFPHLIKNKVLDYIYHEHLNYFSLKSLSFFFEKKGMEIFDVKLLAVKGGSIRIYCSYKKRFKVNLSLIKSLIKDEAEQDSNIQKTINDYEVLKKKLRNDILYYKKEGFIVFLYGASATTTVFSYMNDIIEDLDFVIDDNPKRHNTYLPGSNIVVKSKNILKKFKKKLIIIGAWRFNKLILDKNKLELQNSVIINPLPKYEKKKL